MAAFRSLGWIGFAGIVLLTPAPLRAQPAVPPPAPTAKDSADAKRHFEVGLKLYAERAFLEALGEFEASYRLGGRPSALKNMAQCHRDLKHFAEAYETYARMLAIHDAQLAPAEKAVIRSTLEELAVLTGTLKIAVSEDAADVELDGKSLGGTPLAAPKRVGLGGHKVRVTKAGFEPFEKDVALSSEQVLEMTVKLDKEITTGSLSVREQDGDAVHVLIDGEDKGPAPWEGPLAPGEHVLELKGPKFTSDKRPFHVVRKERLDLVVDATTTMGHLRITTVPASASIKVDDKLLATGVWEGDVDVGVHQIEVSDSAYEKAMRSVNVVRGQALVQEIPLAMRGYALTGGAPDYRGVYARFNLLFAVSPTGTYYEPPPGNGVAASQGGTVGFGAALRIGYNLDVIGIELVTSFLLDGRNQQLDYTGNAMSTETLKITEPSGFFGIGPRVTSKAATVRFTFGVAPGLVVRSVDFGRNNDGNTSPSNGPCGAPSQPTCSTNSGSFGGHAGYTAPGFNFDGGMLIGSTPGTKFYLGLMAIVDFPPTIVVGPDTQSRLPDAAFQVPGRGYIAVHGAQFYFGPTLGLQFGH